MNHQLIEHLWKKLSRSKSGRLVAAALIGGVFGLSAGLSQSRETFTIAMAGAGGTVIAVIAVGILVALDTVRTPTPRGRGTQSHQLPPHLTPPKLNEIKTAKPPSENASLPKSTSVP